MIGKYSRLHSCLDTTTLVREYTDLRLECIYMYIGSSYCFCKNEDSRQEKVQRIMG